MFCLIVFFISSYLIHCAAIVFILGHVFCKFSLLFCFRFFFKTTANWLLTNSLLISLQMGHTLLSDLSLGDDNERICVRVSRFWAFCDQKDDDKILHFGLVLIDEKVRSVQRLP